MLISIRVQMAPKGDLTNKDVYYIQVLGTREECEALNGGAPVDPGVYGQELILTAKDLRLSPFHLLALKAYVPVWRWTPSKEEQNYKKYLHQLIDAVSVFYELVGPIIVHRDMSGGKLYLWCDT
ncbi:MAG: hypothetical protein EB006_02690 [Betaproteobacteria bacterium]|nr:hypothetical protein [Betaproteobacteria bacterium]